MPYMDLPSTGMGQGTGLGHTTGTGTRTEAQVGDTELLSWGSSIVTGDTHCVLWKSFPNLMAVESCTGLKGTLINSKLRLRLCE